MYTSKQLTNLATNYNIIFHLSQFKLDNLTQETFDALVFTRDQSELLSSIDNEYFCLYSNISTYLSTIGFFSYPCEYDHCLKL